MLESLERGRSLVLFYDTDETLEKLLFHYVRAGLERGERVQYWAGINATSDVEPRMIRYGIDCEYYRKQGMLSITSYDEVFVVDSDGRFDPVEGRRKLLSMANGNGNIHRLATESNWWLLSDLFENGIDMEGTHEITPFKGSIICSYNIRNLMKYVNIYHLARLMELHDDTLLVTRGSVMLPFEFYLLLGRCITDVLENSFDYITIVRRKHSRFISEVLQELEMRIGSDMLELERSVEERLEHALKLNRSVRTHLKH
jgi:hypothetical protein